MQTSCFFVGFCTFLPWFATFSTEVWFALLPPFPPVQMERKQHCLFFRKTSTAIFLLKRDKGDYTCVSERPASTAPVARSGTGVV
jgi:hypothetical protein